MTHQTPADMDGGWKQILVEVQAQSESGFAQRMCVYNCRIWERYQHPVVSLALLVDENPRFRPDRYAREKAGCRLEFRFPMVKLLVRTYSNCFGSWTTC